MTWACANGHRVRDGMFICPACGSDDVRERAEGAEVVTDQGAAGARRAAVSSIQGAIGAGSVLYVLGVVACLNGVGGDFDFDGTVFLLGVVIGVIGAGLVLVGIVGYGVKLGNEATERVGGAVDR